MPGLERYLDVCQQTRRNSLGTGLYNFTYHCHSSSRHSGVRQCMPHSSISSLRGLYCYNALSPLLLVVANSSRILCLSEQMCGIFLFCRLFNHIFNNNGHTAFCSIANRKYFDNGINMAYCITYVKGVENYDNANSIRRSKAPLQSCGRS